MDTRGWDRATTDGYDEDCDLALLNLYALLDALDQQGASLRRRIPARWETFQRHQAASQGGIHDDGTR